MMVSIASPKRLANGQEVHDLVMYVFGGMGKGERNRIKVRVRTAD